MQYAIEINDVSMNFRSGRQSVAALKHLDLKVDTGHIFGFLGPNGAGKTTAIHMLLGFIKPSSGHALIFGQDTSKSLARQRIGYMPEHPDTYRFLTGRELLKTAGRLFLLKGKELDARVNELLAMVGMEYAADRKTGSYSRGMLQRIGLAQALVNDPDLVILDEPTSGFDPIGRVEIRKIIARLRDRGKTVFFSSHELSEVELVCDRVGIISKGSLVVEGEVAQLVDKNENLEQYFLRTLS